MQAVDVRFDHVNEVYCDCISLTAGVSRGLDARRALASASAARSSGVVCDAYAGWLPTRESGDVLGA